MKSRVLLHPVTLASMLILALNDHWFKYAFPGWITGKLSDFAGLVFFPAVPGFLGIPLRWAVLLTMAGFSLVKSVPEATLLWNLLFGFIYRTVGIGHGARLICDPTDLIALPCAAVCLLLKGVSDGKENCRVGGVDCGHRIDAGYKSGV